ncbi:unnamed protein product [Vicia faba]|uniref:Uncharacterized protein n=1 Tax=Vicia faba TaxID=3906 RepID=A0AAV1B091_VICFA|nr:unnamed protein product [Vicia faba]
MVAEPNLYLQPLCQLTGEQFQDDPFGEFQQNSISINSGTRNNLRFVLRFLNVQYALSHCSFRTTFQLSGCPFCSHFTGSATAKSRQRNITMISNQLIHVRFLYLPFLSCWHLLLVYSRSITNFDQPLLDCSITITILQ